MIEKDKKAAQYLLFNIKEATFRRRTGCDGGTNTFHISADGGIYPCALAADKVDYWLGDVWKGLQPEKLEALHKINEIPVTGCGDCTFKQNCSSQVCKLINKAYTGDYYTVSAFQCNERDIVYRIYKSINIYWRDSMYSPKVAVVDSGVDTQNQEIMQHVIQGFSFQKVQKIMELLKREILMMFLVMEPTALIVSYNLQSRHNFIL